MNRRDEFNRELLRERVYGEATHGDGRRSLLGALFAVSLFLLILSLSVRQVTAPSNAMVMLESGIAVLTDVDRLIEDEAPRLRLLAENSRDDVFALPGYPLDVAVDREELELEDDELRDRLLARSAALVYAEGVGAFDRTGEQRINRLSSEGLLEFAVAQVSETTHDRATMATMVFGLTTAALGALFVATSSGWGRMRGFGFATAAGALPGVFLFAFFSWTIGQLGGSDGFMEDIREITRWGVRAPLRNFGIVFIAGAVIAVAGIALGYAEKRFVREPAEPEVTFETPAELEEEAL